LPIAARDGRVGVRGLIGRPAAARGSGRWQYFFLNGRFIRDRLLSHALRAAYRGLVDPNRWPTAFVFLTIDPAEVDVNVHPSKLEVRFRDGQLVHGELLAALRETLNKANLTPSALPAAEKDQATPAEGEAVRQQRVSLKEALADFFKTAAPAQRRLDFPAPSRPARPAAGLGEASTASAPAAKPAAPSAALDAQSLPEPAPPAEVPAMPAPAMQVHDSYIVAAEPDGILIIDQHALHERLMYNELARRLTDGDLLGQRLLIPETLTVTAAEADSVAGAELLLRRLGIEVARFGPRTLAIQQFPALLVRRGVSAGEFVRELLDQLAEGDAGAEQMLERILSLMACKAAVKAGDPLTPAEIDDLLARRAEAERVSACPHGRPTTLKLTLKDLEKQFQRT